MTKKYIQSNFVSFIIGRINVFGYMVLSAANNIGYDIKKKKGYRFFETKEDIIGRIISNEIKKNGFISEDPKTVFFINRGFSYPIIGAIIFSIFFISHKAVLASKIRCSDYKTQEMAQIAFDSNPHYYYMLDRDHNGRACEHLPKIMKVK